MIWQTFVQVGHGSPAVLNPANVWKPFEAETRMQAFEMAAAEFLSPTPAERIEFTIWIFGDKWPRHESGRPMMAYSYQATATPETQLSA